jgi:penicillin amidase
MKALQLDNYSIRAEEGVPALLTLLGEDPPISDEMAREMYTDLKAWDYRYDADKRAPAVYQEWYARIYRLTFDELYLRPDSNSLLYPEHWLTIDLLAKQPGHTVFDQTTTPQRESAADIVRMAWEQTVQSLAGIYRTPEAAWAGYQKASVPHLARLNGFGSDILPSGGFRDAPNALSKHHGPSWRMVVELTQPVKAFGVYPGGQSGNPGSPYYDTGLDYWAKGEYFTLSFWATEPEAARQHQGATWTFK